MIQAAKNFNFSFFNLETGVVATVGAAVTPILNYFYGEGSLVSMKFLLICVCLDWISGIAASHKDQTYSSEYGINGILRTVFILALPAAGHGFDELFATGGLAANGITIALIYHTFNSMTANTARAGWERWIPNKMLMWVASEIKAKTARATVRQDKREEVISPIFEDESKENQVKERKIK